MANFYLCASAHIATVNCQLKTFCVSLCLKNSIAAKNSKTFT